ncbi:MAG: Trk system potassium uptake protein TrkA [Candidatus Ozemobacter sibiricus]|jgi:trk system potassium uptake protein TrkA|uniref:Trk system potassium uptake protein TrkA n=1 Tax=Candidatus Ozemobacter sibiricus TaxID=2268124 RepID=A0A367ZQH8_9BACT|nr:MAG: Trk system potassium uptake protein TrkA [Candidatus Ozemobacter sibiricus]
MQFVVIGVGRFGAKLAISLFARGGEVMALDRNEAAIDRLKDHVSHVAIADCTDEIALRNLGIQDMDVAIVAIGENVETSIMATALLRRLGVPRILSRAMSRTQAQILMEVGATEVFSLEEQMGEQMASRLIAPHILESITLSSGHSLIEVVPPKEFLGRTLKDLNLRAKAGVNVIAIKRKLPAINERGENVIKIELNDLPSPDQEITRDDILVVVGQDERLRALTEPMAREVQE